MPAQKATAAFLKRLIWLDILSATPGSFGHIPIGIATSAGPRARELVIGYLTPSAITITAAMEFPARRHDRVSCVFDGHHAHQGAHAKPAAACGLRWREAGAFTAAGEQAMASSSRPSARAGIINIFLTLRLGLRRRWHPNSVEEFNLRTDRRDRANPKATVFSLTNDLCA